MLTNNDILLSFLGYSYNEESKKNELIINGETINFDLNDTETIHFETKKEWLDEVWFKIMELNPNAVLMTSKTFIAVKLNENTTIEFNEPLGADYQFDAYRYYNIMVKVVKHINQTNNALLTTKITDFLLMTSSNELGSYATNIIGSLVSGEFDSLAISNKLDELKKEYEQTISLEVTRHNVFKVMLGETLVKLKKVNVKFPDNEFIINKIDSYLKIELYSQKEGEYIDECDISDILIIS